MRFTLSTIAFAGAGIFFSTVVNAASTPDQFPFPLRAWHDPREIQYPRISHYVELDSAGNAIINKTAGATGFKSYIDPTPQLGTLHTFTGDIGYLMPVSSSTPRHYQLQYNKGVPKIAGVLYTNFTTAGRDCGGNCGGATLDYDRGTGFNGEWYIIPIKSESDRKIWALRWIATADRWTRPTFPEGSIPVFLWKS